MAQSAYLACFSMFELLLFRSSDNLKNSQWWFSLWLLGTTISIFGLLTEENHKKSQKITKKSQVLLEWSMFSKEPY